MSMSTDLARYHELLRQKAEAQKRGIDIDVEIQVLNKRMELNALAAGGAGAGLVSETDGFIERHRDELDDEDLEFLSKEYRSTKECCDHTMMAESSFKREAIARGKIEFEKSETNRYRFKTVSVLAYFLKAEDK